MFEMMLTSFKIRFRRHSFWLTLVSVLLLTVVFTPQANQAFKVMVINPGTFRQGNNSSWLPVSAAIMFGLFLPLVGFSFVQNALAEDQTSGLWNWQFTSHFSRIKMCLAKFMANFLLLFCLLLTTILGVVLMNALRFWGNWVSFRTLIMPFVPVLPSMAFIAALALVVEVVINKPHTKLTISAIFGLLVLFIMETFRPLASFWNIFSVSGINYQIQTLSHAVKVASGGTIGNMMFLTSSSGSEGTQDLLIQPLAFTTQQMFWWLSEFIMSIFLVMGCSYFIRPQKPVRQSTSKADQQVVPGMPAEVTYMGVAKRHFSFGQLLKQTLKNVLSMTTKWQLFLLVSVWLVALVALSDSTATIFVPLLSLFALPFMSALERDQKTFNTWTMVVPNGISRKLKADICGGFLLHVVAFLPIIVHFPLAFPQLVTFSLMLASVDVLLGVLVGNDRALILVLGAFWFLYLNGATSLLPAVKFSGLATVFYLLGSALAIGVMAGSVRQKVIPN